MLQLVFEMVSPTVVFRYAEDTAGPGESISLSSPPPPPPPPPPASVNGLCLTSVNSVFDAVAVVAPIL